MNGFCSAAWRSSRRTADDMPCVALRSCAPAPQRYTRVGHSVAACRDCGTGNVPCESGLVQFMAYVSLKHLAEQMGLDRSNARKYVLKIGIKPKKRRTADSGGQLALTVTEREAERVLEHRKQMGFSSSEKSVDTDTGVFYVIQLVPELDPKRIKLGFANDLADRLSQHRTAAPTAKTLKSWPCRRSWEGTVMDCLAAVSCQHVLNEVFECDDVEALLAKGDALFGLLPSPTDRPEVSDHSPLRQDRP